MPVSWAHLLSQLSISALHFLQVLLVCLGLLNIFFFQKLYIWSENGI